MNKASGMIFQDLTRAILLGNVFASHEKTLAQSPFYKNAIFCKTLFKNTLGL